MSLLHGAKKHFLVFLSAVVLIAGGMVASGAFVSGKTADEYKKAYNTARAKSIIGYAMACFSSETNNYSQTNNDPVTLAMLREGKFTNDNEYIDEVASGYVNSGLYYLYGYDASRKSVDNYNQCDEMSIFAVINALDNLTGGQTNVYNSLKNTEDGDLADFYLDNVYVYTKSKEDTRNCLIKQGEYHDEDCEKSALDVDISGKDSKFYSFLNSTYSPYFNNLFTDFTDEEKYWLAYDANYAYFQSGELEAQGLEKVQIDPNSSEIQTLCNDIKYQKNCYRFLNTANTGWDYWKIIDHSQADFKDSFRGKNTSVSAYATGFNKNENKVLNTTITETQLIANGATQHYSSVNGFIEDIEEGNISSTGNQIIDAQKEKDKETAEKQKEEISEGDKEQCNPAVFRTAASGLRSALVSNGYMHNGTGGAETEMQAQVTAKYRQYFPNSRYPDGDYIMKSDFYGMTQLTVKRDTEKEVYSMGNVTKKIETSNVDSFTIAGIERYTKDAQMEVKGSDGTSAGSRTCYWKVLYNYLRDNLQDELSKIAGSEVKLDDENASFPPLQTIVYTVTDDTPTYTPPSTNLGISATDYEADTCYAGAGVVGWLLCPAINVASEAGEGLWSMIEDNHLKVPAYAIFGTASSTQKPGVRQAWERIRDFANIFFVVVFLIVILSQVTGRGINNYGIKKMLPKLIIAIILVNLSYVICQLVVDIANTVGVSIQNLFDSIAEGIKGSSMDYASGLELSTGKQVGSWAFLAILAGGGTTAFALLSATWGPGKVIGGIVLFLLGIVIVILVSLLTLYVTLAVREAAIIMGIAIAPLAIMCNVLPNTEQLFKKWLSLMKAVLMLYPICGFVIGGSKVAGIVLASTGLNSMRLAAGVVQVVPYFFIPSLLRKSLQGLGNIGAKIGALGKSWGNRAASSTKRGIKNTKRYQEMAAMSQENAAMRRANRIRNAINKKEAKGHKITEGDKARRADAIKEINRIKAERRERTNAGQAGYEQAALADALNSIDNKNKNLMTGFGGGTENPDGSFTIDQEAARKYAEAASRRNSTEATKSRDSLAIGYGGAKKNADGTLTYSDERAAQIARGNIAQGAVQAENSAAHAARIGRNGVDYMRGMRKKGEVESRNEVEKLIGTYGGGKFDPKTGRLLKNADGTYQTDEREGHDYARAVAAKSEMDLSAEAEATRAFGRGVYGADGKPIATAETIQGNYLTRKTNELNRTLAGNIVKSNDVTLSEAVKQFDQKAKLERLQTLTSQFKNMSSIDVKKMADDYRKAIGDGSNMDVQMGAALVNALVEAKDEKGAQELFNEMTAGAAVSLATQQEIARSVEPKDIAGIKGYQSVILKASKAHSYNDFMLGGPGVGIIKREDGTETGNDMLSWAALALKKPNAINAMDSDTIANVADSISKLAPGTMQTVISGKQALYNILNVAKDGAQKDMKTIIDKTDSSEFDNLGISGAKLASEMEDSQLENIVAIAEKSARFKSEIEKTLLGLSHETIDKMTNRQKEFYRDHFDVGNFGADNTGGGGA